MEWLIAYVPITKAQANHLCSGHLPGRRSSAKVSAAAKLSGAIAAGAPGAAPGSGAA